MAMKDSSSLSLSHRGQSGEDDFLSRFVNLGWDGDSDWTFTDESVDILSFKCDVINLAAFSREPSRDELILHQVCKSRKSSLEKPIGHIMQLKPKPFVNESIKSSFWGKFLSKKNSRELLNEDNEKLTTYSMDKPRNSQDVTNEFHISAEQKQDNVNSVKSSLVQRSKSVDVIQKQGSSCAEESKAQAKDGPVLKQTSKDSNTIAQNRRNVKTKKHFSVYSKNFHLNSRFLSKSYYPMSYWRPNRSFPMLKGRSYTPSESEYTCTRGRRNFLTDTHHQNCDKISCNFNTYFPSWICEPEAKKLEKTTQINKKQKCHNKNCKQRKYIAKTQQNEDRRDRNHEGCSTRTLSNRLHDSLSCSNISLPTIFNHGVFANDKQRTYKFEQFPSLSCDDLLRQYQKQHVDLTKVNARKRSDPKNTQKCTRKM